MKLNLKTIVETIAGAVLPVQKQETYIGVDYNHSKLFSMELETSKRGKAITRFAVEPIVSGPNGVDEALVKLLDRENLSGCKVSIALSGSSVLVRFISYPKMSLADLKNSMRYEIEKYIPFQANDVISEFYILGDEDADGKTMRVLLVAAKKTAVVSIIEGFQKANLNIRLIDIHALACLNAFLTIYKDAESQKSMLLDVGRTTSSLIILDGKDPAFLREIVLGSDDVVEGLKKKVAGYSEASGPEALGEILLDNESAFEGAIEPLASQIRLSLNYYKNHNPDAPPPECVFISGDLAQYKIFPELLEKAVGLKVIAWDCLEGVTCDVSKLEIEAHRNMLPTCLGLAMRRD